MTPAIAATGKQPERDAIGRRLIATLFGLSLLVLATPELSAAEKSGVKSASGPVDSANPICGTGTFPAPAGDNNTFPGATLPFGMIQWSPDTEAGLHMGGYDFADRRISDFSVDHISGAGARYGGDFAMMPIAGPLPSTPPAQRTAFAAEFSHDHEIARPGAYAVTFDNGNRVELAATLRTGFGRFTYAGTGAATLMVNAASDINGSDAAKIEIEAASHAISGWSTGGHFGHPQDRVRDVRTIYFYAVFDHPFSSWSTWSGKDLVPGGHRGRGTAAGAYLGFDLATGRTVAVRVGISYVSVANAQANVAAENPVTGFSADDFTRTAAAGRAAWNQRLGQIELGGATRDQEQRFYSMMYHALLGPIVVSDANGDYFGYDGQVHAVEKGRRQYGVFSGWDIYRCECQLLALIAPKEASDMAQSLLMDYRQGGAFPRWGVVTEDSGIMVGDPAAGMIAGFHAFGARDFDVKAALAGLVRAATDPAVTASRTQTKERDAMDDYLKLGYVPEHPAGGYGPVSMTLEFASADFAVAQLAKALGDDTTSARLLRQAQNWRTLYNPATGFLQMRRRDGSWSPGFVDDHSYYGNERAYVEGSASQYVWMVPFNYEGLAERMGGRQAALARLDRFFEKLNAGYSKYAYLGNETCIATPWIYDFYGQPWQTQRLVRCALQELYSSGPAAYPGNDDVGSMSAWYIFASLGLYPELPGSDVLVLGSPLYPKAILHRAGGDVIIVAHGAAPDAPYVQGLSVNGQTWTKPWLRFADLAHGGSLVFALGPKPRRDWGAAPGDAPPSYDSR